MKKINLIIAGIAVMLMITVTSCKKFLDVNQNDNEPTSVNPKVLLPSAEASLAYSMGGDASRFTSIFMQYITGASRQFYSYDRYIMSEEDFNNLWNNLYASSMMDMHDIIAYADAHPGQYTNYQAMAKILMAYSLGLTTDLWGDIPYSDAFKGLDAIHPKYDTQDKIYVSIQKLLDEAIDSIANDPGDDVGTPYEDDFIFNGDGGSWTSFAQGLKARFHLHLSKVDPAAYTNVLADLTAGGLSSNGGDAQYGFNSVAQNPWYQYINNRDDIAYDGSFIQTVIANNDPRIAVLLDNDDSYWGGGGWSNHYLGPQFSADNAPVVLFSYSEQKFIEAEAKLMTGDNAGAQTAFTEGITANFSKWGTTDSLAVYLAAHGTLTGTQPQMLAQIIWEKYVATYLQTESWVDYRRLNNPLGLSPNAGVLSEIPRRFIYPTNEKLYNPNIPTTSSSLLAPRLWWDN